MTQEGTKRKGISKKLRFEVFKRDGFVCQYCGATPPSVILHVDHIHPVAGGGKNHIDNLITACEPCNLGKGARVLSDIPKSLKDKATEVAEREEQIKGYNYVLQMKAARIEDDAWAVAAALSGQEYIESFNRLDLLSIKRFLEKLPVSDLLDAADISMANIPWSEKKRFKYFCGVCWNRIREADHG